MDATEDRKQFAPIEGLRAYLALWVALDHAFETSGILSLPGPLRFIMNGEKAVDIFMILSGFVITHLLLTKPDTYARYITRRCFRLYPLFIIGCIVGYGLMYIWPTLVIDVPWASEPGWQRYADELLIVADQTTANTLPHALLHATMLHGAVPLSWLPEASKTFLPAAWSISLEWQFYLIAPLLIWCCRKPLPFTLVTAAFVVGLFLFRRNHLGHYSGTSFLFIASGFFAIGVASRYVFNPLKRLILDSSSPWRVSVAVLFLVFCFAPEHVALSIWVVFFFYLMNPAENVVHRTIDALVTNRLALTIGAISYSVYLANRPIEVLFGWCALREWPSLTRADMFASQLAAIAVSIVVAYYSWKWIEVPGQKLGAAIVRRLPPRRAFAS